MSIDNMSNALPVTDTRGGWMKAKEVAAFFGIGLSTIWKMVRRNPDFPQPRKFSARCTRWLRSEVEAYAATL